jgi:hypothetical protein
MIQDKSYESDFDKAIKKMKNKKQKGLSVKIEL